MIVEGYVSGLHKSPYSGFSVEFAEHREYAPGDDVRYVDWKVFGKTAAFISSGSRRRPTSPVTFCWTRANRWRTARRGRPSSKLEYAQYVAAALAHLVIRQQDAVGLATFNTSVTRFLPPSSQPVASQAGDSPDGAHGGRRRDGPRDDLSRSGRTHRQARAW